MGIVGSAATSQREKHPPKLKPLKPIKTPKVDSLHKTARVSDGVRGTNSGGFDFENATDRASPDKEGGNSRMTERGNEGVDDEDVAIMGEPNSENLTVVPEGRNTHNNVAE